MFPKPLTFQKASSYYIKIENQNAYFRPFLGERIIAFVFPVFSCQKKILSLYVLNNNRQDAKVN